MARTQNDREIDLRNELIKADVELETARAHLIRCAVIFSEGGDELSASNARSWASKIGDRSHQRTNLVVESQLAILSAPGRS